MTFGLAHHDPSPLYVSDPHPVLGDTVTLRVRVPDAHPLERLHLRYLLDGEGTFVEAHPAQQGDGETWWSAEVVMANPTLQYRWFLEGPLHPGGAWLNGTGVHARDVPDVADFRLITAAPPAWVEDAVVYQVFCDRFARSADADARPLPGWALPAAWDDPLRTYAQRQQFQLYGGDLDGVAEHLDHLVSLGVTVLYLTPFFPAESNHRYNATSFDEVDPLLGGDAALTRLIDAAHARGIRVIGDFTPNHTGSGHGWFRTGRDDPASAERGFYTWDADGPGYASWLGFASLPKLNHASAELTERLTGPDGVLRRWLRAGLDGWRIDVANMTGRLGAVDDNRAVAHRIREAVDAEGDRWLVAEHFYDLHHDVDGFTWHGAMNYTGFSRPAWAWLEQPDSAEEDAHFAVTARIPAVDGPGLVAVHRDFTAQVPWSVTTASFNIVGSHDTGRIRWRVGDHRGRVLAALGLAHTLPGAPMLYYGDEIGLTGSTGEYGRRPFPWQAPQTWDHDLLAAVRRLGALRHELPALRRGGLRWIGAVADAVAFVREAPEGSVLVLVARDSAAPIEVDAALLPGVASGRAVLGEGITVADGRVSLRAHEAGVAVWAW